MNKYINYKSEVDILCQPMLKRCLLNLNKSVELSIMDSGPNLFNFTSSKIRKHFQITLNYAF